MPDWYSSSRQWQVLRDRARKMRKEPTPAEAALWQALRDRKLGVNFRRQHPIGRYIADFFAPVPKLIVEVDGEIHSVQQLEDEEREGNLVAAEFALIRFTNDEVLKELPRVLAAIRAEVDRLGARRGQDRKVPLRSRGGTDPAQRGQGGVRSEP